MMANLVKSANLEIEKSKTYQSKHSEIVRKSEADAEAYKGYLLKLRTNLSGKGLEVDSIIDNIFREIDTYGSGRIELTSYLGDLHIADQRVQSLIREKDADLSRLRDELVALKRLKSTVNNGEAHSRTIQILQD